jgi:hypothetical protein
MGGEPVKKPLARYFGAIVAAIAFLGFLRGGAAPGRRFALSRLAIDILGIVVIAWAIKAALPAREVERLYAEAEKMD